MKADKKFSNLSMLEKRKRLMDMVDMRKKMKRKKTERPILMFENGDKINSKKPINGSTKKKLNAYIYKKMFQSARSKDEQRPDKSIKEYWIPVHLSRMQMEQYCSLLHSNFEKFSSSLRDNSSLHEILTQTQKCCDHPYLVDPSLRGSLQTNAPIDQLDAEINVSGKLQLLDKLLLEMERRRLRVVVLFQSVVNSEKITGDILDDLVDRRFGQDSYIHIRGKIYTNSEREKRKIDLKMFNSVESKKFICLVDYRACYPTIRLSGVDVAILFNSDWNPLNDVKALHKLTVDSRERLRVLRLYSPFTIEEKALILSKQGINIFEKNTSSIKYKFYHQLLAWGVSYLLSKVSNDSSSESSSKSKSKSKLKSKSDTYPIDDLVHEVSSLLLSKSGNTDCLKRSIISNAQMRDGSYSRSVLLLGEIESRTNESFSIEESLREKGPLVFWTGLFKDIPWKDSSNNRLSRRVEKSFRKPWYWFEEYEIENEIPVTTKLRSKRKGRNEIKRSTNNVAECTNNQPQELQTSPVIPPVCEIERGTNYDAECPNNQPQQPHTSPVVPPMAAPLETELENIKKEQEGITKLHQEEESMLVSEREKEILEIWKKYEALIDESKMCATKKMKVLEEFYDLVYANKILAETLKQACDDTVTEEKTEKETSSLKIVEIRASTLVQSKKPCTTSVAGGHSLGGTGIIRDPAPHLRSNPSLFASLPTFPNSQTKTEFNNVNNDVNTEKTMVLQSTHSWPEVFEDFNSLFDMGYPNLPFLDSN